MIEKQATYNFRDVELLGSEKTESNEFIRTAATKIGLDSNPEAKSIVQSEIDKHPTALFFKAKAIAADEVNSNGDYFSSEELKNSYSTFVGVPFYTNHNNQDIEQARGKIIFAEWKDEDSSIYVIGFIDREAYPHICRGVEQEYMTGVSMGCSVEYSECSICENKASTVEEYCNHVKFRKGRTFTGTSKNAKTGAINSFKDAPVFEHNYGIRFIELSGVGDPACKSCHIEGILDNDEALLQRAAKVQNNVYMYKSCSLAKESSQEEIDQLNQCLDTIENIAVNLIHNRKQVETEFSTDLVQILADLQEFTDELVGAGYGQFDGEGEMGLEGEIPGTVMPGADGALPGEEIASMGAPEGLGTTPVSEEIPGEDIGDIMGSPSTPALTMPTPPARPMRASTTSSIEKVSEKISELRSRLAKASEAEIVDEEKDMKRRTPSRAAVERDSVIIGLEAAKKENGAGSENIPDYGVNIIESGGNAMSGLTREADRQEAPERITEVQLDSGIKNHPRQDDEKNSITQVQLEDKRSGNPEVTTEVQLRDNEDSIAPGDRSNIAPERTTQKQLRDNEGNQAPGANANIAPESTTQEQLEGSRVGNPEVITEVQLEDKPKDIYSRSSFLRKEVKTAGEHLADVITVLAQAAIDSGATPAETRGAVAGLVDGLQAQNETAEAITDEVSDDDKGISNVAARTNYWGGKGIKVAANLNVGDRVTSLLRVLVAEDESVSPTVIMDVLDVVAEDADSIDEISAAVDQIMATDSEELTEASSKDQIRAALKKEQAPEVTTEAASSEGAIEQRASERSRIRSAIATPKDGASEKKPSHVIMASLEEVGLTAESATNKDEIRKAVSGFIKSLETTACKVEKTTWSKDDKGQMKVASVDVGSQKGLKVAAITNVTIDGDTISIAVQTDEGGEVEVPLAGEEVGPDVAPIEGDIGGENLDAMVGEETDIGDIGGAPVPPAPDQALPVAAAKDGIQKEASVKTAQFGGDGGGLPGGEMGGPGAGAEMPPAGAPDAGMDGGLQTFTDEGPAEEEEPGVGEQMMPGTICPFCHSTDTTVGEEGREPGVFACNECSGVYRYSVQVELLNPDKMSFEKDGDEIGIKEPELPELPVAAQVDLNKSSLQKIAASEAKFGHVCPACGMTQCKPQEGKTAGVTSYVCPSCETKTTKEIFVSSKDPKDSFLQIAWNLDPKKVSTAGCGSCKEAARKFAAEKRVLRMMRAAATAEGEGGEFPRANCTERLARMYGTNAIASFGPCKGMPLTDCVCDRLETFNMRKVRDMVRLADVYTQEDPMDQCHQDHLDKGYNEKQASTICGALRKKYASEADDNEWVAAFGEEDEYSIEELRVMKEKWEAKASAGSDLIREADLDEDIGAPLPELDEQVAESVVIELDQEVASDIGAQIDEASTEVEIVSGSPEIEAASTGATKVAAKDCVNCEDCGKECCPECKKGCECDGKGDCVCKGGKEATSKDELTREAKAPTVVDGIEQDVEAGIPRSDATMGNEGAANIDVSEATPNVPRANATMGEEEALTESLPDIPVDNAHMGGEAEALSGTPAINSEMIGQVVAGTEGKIIQEAKKPTQVEDIEKDVEAGIPRADATMGNEGAANIDVTEAAPSIPRADATMGQEEALTESLPDVPVDNAHMGGEAEALSGTPGMNSEIRGRVIADRKDKQMDRIAIERHKKACVVAARLVGERRVAGEDMEEVIEVLAKLELNKMERLAEKMFKAPPAPLQAQAASTVPMVEASSSYAADHAGEVPGAAQATQQSQLEDIFTIGSKDLNDSLSEDGKR
jgi:hypothetical protein